MQATTTRIRLLSALALLLLLAVFATGTILIISNPELILLYVICALGLITGGWLMLSSHTSRLWWGLAISSVSIALTLLTTWTLLFRSNNLSRLLLLVVLGLAYSTSVTVVARLYWQQQRKTASPTPQNGPAVLIVNPKSGNGRATKAHVTQIAKAQGIETITTRPDQDMVALAEQSVAKGAKVLGISGGDGSLGAIASVAIKHNLPLVVLPGGTRCHFARDIGLDPNQITAALDGFRGTERRVDVGQIQNRIFLNNASFGLYADIISHQEYRNHKLEVTMRTAHNLASSKQPYYPLNFKDRQDHFWHHAAQVFVGVNHYETLNLIEIGERKRMDEGILHIVAMRSLTSAALQQLSGSYSLNQTSNSTWKQWTTKSFEISDPSGWIDAGVDGESVHFQSPVSIKLLPKALRLLVPAGGAHSRPIAPISKSAAKTLWTLITSKNPDPHKP